MFEVLFSRWSSLFQSSIGFPVKGFGQSSLSSFCLVTPNGAELPLELEDLKDDFVQGKLEEALLKESLANEAQPPSILKGARSLLLRKLPKNGQTTILIGGSPSEAAGFERACRILPRQAEICPKTYCSGWIIHPSRSIVRRVCGFVVAFIVDQSRVLRFVLWVA